MNLEFPPDARVQIFVAPAGAFPLADGTIIANAPTAHRPRRRLVKSAALVALVGGAYFLGGHTVRQASALQALAVAHGTQLQADSHAAPEPREVPRAFAQQLQQPPTITPAPGAPAKSAFGLED